MQPFEPAKLPFQNLWRYSMRRIFFAVCLTFCLNILACGPNAVAQDETPQERAQLITAQAVKQFNLAQFDDAQKLLEQSLGIDEDIYQTHFWLGRVYATKAGNSPEARQKAILHFRRAVALQEYGDEGDLARSWLVRFEGRPKKILVVAVKHPSLQTYDEGASNSVAGAVANGALVAKYPAAISKNGAFDLGELSLDRLSEICHNDQGGFDIGWMIGIAVENVKDDKSEAKVWIFDPVAKQLYEPISFSTKTKFMKFGYKANGTSITGNETLDDLSSKVWRRCRPIVGGNSDSKILDEVQFPSAVAGIYARASLPYEQAVQLPLIMVTPVTALDEDGADATREIAADLLQAIMEPKRLAAISPGSTRQIFKVLKIEEKKATIEDVARAGQNLGCRYAIVPVLTRYDLQSKNLLIGTKVTAKVSLNVKVVECVSAKEVSSKVYERSASTMKLGGDGLTQLLEKREKILNEIILAAATDLQALAQK